MELPLYIRGLGAGASPNETGYHTENIMNNRGTLGSPHIIAGFISTNPEGGEDLIRIFSMIDSECINSLKPSILAISSQGRGTFYVGTVGASTNRRLLTATVVLLAFVKLYDRKKAWRQRIL